MRRLWLVRHARPLVAPGTCYGRLDMPADAGDTALAAAALADALPPGCRVVCSPLQRCVQLATELVRLRPGLGVERDPRLAEMDFGDWEGRPWAELGASALDAWAADFADFAPGGGETVTAFMARVGSAFDGLADGDTAWIAHAGVIRAASLIAQGRRVLRCADEWPSSAIDFGSFTALAVPACRP